ncbi:hypothetical protein LAG90_17550 [Marinilongibacter aquaticus]|uniref:hypothetical protein n=1 Tax=Marinilongibacter aquaticus TaxID=2975157 RepID=UPI0021BDA4A5|nr:hypothetical protein [Marinilongibacter aquaticus]UBM58607.1 hypothetical protein LAG90_17550 [Marinilongibacter aquaticus]
MQKHLKITLSTIFLLTAFQGIAQDRFLKKTWKKQVEPLEGKYLTFDFTESLNQLGHNFYPWQQTHYQGNGQIWCSTNAYAKLDSLKAGQRIYSSKTLITEKDMLLLDFGDKDLSRVTHEMYEEQIFKTARYSPLKALAYFVSQDIPLSKESSPTLAVYETRINNTLVKLYIDKRECLLTKILTLSDDELFGDVETEYVYSNYTEIDDLQLALDIDIKKINGKLLDQVHLSKSRMTDNIPALLERPEGYELLDEVQTPAEITSEKYNESIHLLELKHTDDKVLIVEFSDFLLVAEAPLHSENGELIIEEARKIAPHKPIKYFVFGHYHPHYLGGIRPFVHKGAKIIASKQDEEYVSYIVHANHSLNPDSLQIEPKPLIFEEIKDSLSLSDSKTEMKIYFIGETSAHTKDYLIYYFPKEKILFEDDLVWIPKSGEIKKASKRQAGLYKAIQDLGIEVETIIQSWPVKDYGVKTVIPFEDLEKSMQVKE